MWELKREAPEIVAAVPLGPPAGAGLLDAVRAAHGRALDDDATWCALAERHGSDWHHRPDGCATPLGATARARADLADG